MTNLSTGENRRYLRAGSIYVASTLSVLAWGDVLTLMGRTDLRFDRPATWVCVALTVLALVGLSGLVGGAAVGTDTGSSVFRTRILLYVALAIVAAAVVDVVGTAAYRQLAWLATLVLICAAFALALASTTWGIVGVVVAIPACLLVTRQPAAMFLFATVLVVNLLYVRLAMWIFGLMRELDAARQTIASLSVERERLRFARDLHDVLGRSLSTIALKSELALTVQGDDDAKNVHVREARDTAQRALNDMRALVRGYRDLDMGTEIDDALMLLRSASVFAEATGDGGAELDSRAAGVAAWVVREAVTNVLKHAPGATDCSISVDGRVVEVTNDGVTGVGDGVGTGLTGMRERVESVGGTFRTETVDGFFRVSCEFPVQSRLSRLHRRTRFGSPTTV